METAEAIKLLRSSLGLSQERLARELDVSWRTVARYEAGGNPDVLELAKLQKFALEHGRDAIATVFEALIDVQVAPFLTSTRNTAIAAGRIRKAIDDLSSLAIDSPALQNRIAPIVGDLTVALNRLRENEKGKP